MDVKYFLYISSYFLLLVESKKDKHLFCAVCRTLVVEVNWIISQVDPKKKIQVGSFRVDTNGNQDRSEIPYARSESHLIEVMEKVCEKMNDYAKTTATHGHTTLVRIRSHEGNEISVKQMSFDVDFNKKIKLYCDTIIEDHEEEMVALFRRENLPDLENAICAGVVESCTGEDLSEPLPVADMEKDEDDGSDNDNETDDEDDDLLETDKQEL